MLRSKCIIGVCLVAAYAAIDADAALQKPIEQAGAAPAKQAGAASGVSLSEGSLLAERDGRHAMGATGGSGLSRLHVLSPALALDSSLAGGLPANAGDAGASETPSLEMPAPPSSLALVLSGLLSLGAYQGVRSLKRWNVSVAAPDWYHTGGPTQIGHKTPVSFDLSDAPLMACVFETPIATEPLIGFRQEAAAPIRALAIPFRVIPRGPPQCDFA